MTRRNGVSAILLMLLWVGWLVLSGCSSGSDSRALFTMPQLYTYERHAVFGLDPEQEQVFMAAYLNTFSGRLITFVERSRLREVITEQDLLKGRLNEATRAKIKRILGVEALILCDYSADEEGRQKKFRVRIVDSETGAIVGSVVVEGYGDFDRHARAATEALRADLLSGSRKAYRYEPGVSRSGGG